MVKIKSPEESTKKYAKRSLDSYIWGEPNCTLNWIKGIIRKSGIKPDVLKQIFDELKHYASMQRYEEIYELCEKVEFDSGEII